VKNFQNLIDTEERTIKPQGSLPTEFGWKNYFHLESIFSWMDYLIAESDFVSPLELGHSFEGNPIRGLTISKRSGNFAVVIEGGIHGREWIATSASTFIIDQLIHSTG
jgi:murein tripeptide amidase MpaA